MENLNYDVDYDAVETEEVYVDQTNTVVTQEELAITPLDVIKAHAEQIGQELVDPNPNCKDCFGRGYTGRDAASKAPIPCPCIQPNFKSAKSVNMYNRTRKLSRKERRELDRDTKKRVKRGLI